MEGGTQLGNLLVFAGGMDAIGEQYDEEFALGIDPDASAGEAGVTETVC